MPTFRSLARAPFRLLSNYSRVFPAANMDTGSDANGGNDAGSEKGTSVDGGPLEENGTHGASPASESRASGPEPSSGSPGRLSRHKKTSPPSKTGGRGWMPPPLKKFFSSDSWFGKKSGKIQMFGVSLSLSHFSLSFARDTRVWQDAFGREKKALYLWERLFDNS